MSLSAIERSCLSQYDILIFNNDEALFCQKIEHGKFPCNFFPFKNNHFEKCVHSKSWNSFRDIYMLFQFFIQPQYWRIFFLDFFRSCLFQSCLV